MLVPAAYLLATPRSEAVVAPPPSLQTDGGPAFVAVAATFVDAQACAAHLAALIKASAPPAYDGAVGPYLIAAGDVRAHRVVAKGWGHEIEEHRCLGAILESRTWSQSLSDVKPITIEDIGGMSFPKG